MMAPDCRSGQSVKLTFLSKLSLIIAMVGDWGEPVDKEELDNNIKEDILIGIFCQKDFFCPTDILFQHFSTRRHSYPNYGSSPETFCPTFTLRPQITPNVLTQGQSEF